MAGVIGVGDAESGRSAVTVILGARLWWAWVPSQFVIQVSIALS